MQVNEATEAECQTNHDRLYEVMARYERPSQMNDEEKALFNGHIQAHERAKALKEVFWTQVHEEFPQILMRDRRGIGARKGWKVVFLAERERHVDIEVVSIGDLSALISALGGARRGGRGHKKPQAEPAGAES